MRYRASYPHTLSRRWDDAPAAGIDLALCAYLMFGLAFLCPLTAPVGVAMAYAGRTRGSMVARSHFQAQISLFWRSLIVLLALGVLHAVVLGLGAVTFGVGLVFMVVPWTLGLGWLVWAVWLTGSGALRAWRREPA